MQVVLRRIKPPATPSFFLGKPSPKRDVLGRSGLSTGAPAAPAQPPASPLQPEGREHRLTLAAQP